MCALACILSATISNYLPAHSGTKRKVTGFLLPLAVQRGKKRTGSARGFYQHILTGHILTGNQLDLFVLTISNGTFFKDLVKEDGTEL